MFLFGILKIKVNKETSYKNKRLNNKIPLTILMINLYKSPHHIDIYVYINYFIIPIIYFLLFLR